MDACHVTQGAVSDTFIWDSQVSSLFSQVFHFVRSSPHPLPVQVVTCLLSLADNEQELVRTPDTHFGVTPLHRAAEHGHAAPTPAT